MSTFHLPVQKLTLISCLFFSKCAWKYSLKFKLTENPKQIYNNNVPRNNATEPVFVGPAAEQREQDVQNAVGLTIERGECDLT